MKSEIRQRLLKHRQSLSRQETIEQSEVISNKLTKLACVRDAKCIMAYLAFRNEVDLKPLFQFCKEKGIRAALPRTTGSGVMQAAEYTDSSILQKNKYGIYEPSDTCVIEKENIDVIIVPAVAFDEDRYRIGYGGGYYDRFLENTKAVKIGVCFNFQIVNTLPKEEHDIRMDMIISEKRTLRGAL